MGPCFVQAIDDQVEQLATGVSRSIGSLWQGASGMLRSGITYGQRVAEQVENSTAFLCTPLQPVAPAYASTGCLTSHKCNWEAVDYP